MKLTRPLILGTFAFPILVNCGPGATPVVDEGNSSNSTSSGGVLTATTGGAAATGGATGAGTGGDATGGATASTGSSSAGGSPSTGGGSTGGAGTGGAEPVYWASGVLQNVEEIDLEGWTVCHTEYYAYGAITVSSVLGACSGSKLLLACRPTGETRLTLAAMANRADVLYDCGNKADCTHEANGVGWYFSDSYSWGFVPAGSSVNRDACDDTVNHDKDLRMCWHTEAGEMTGGYRCGNNKLNADTGYEKVIYHAP